MYTLNNKYMYLQCKIRHVYMNFRQNFSQKKYVRHFRKNFSRDCSLHTQRLTQRKPLSWTFCSTLIYVWITKHIQYITVLFIHTTHRCLVLWFPGSYDDNQRTAKTGWWHPQTSDEEGHNVSLKDAYVEVVEPPSVPYDMPVTLDNLKDQVKIKTMPIHICVFPQNTMTIWTLRQTQTNDYSNPRKKKRKTVIQVFPCQSRLVQG